ncbi:hypothetical protein J6590_103418 [Homalodisca vitripennis]|nr:hypothetical protein J6590_103418 [Homalodisca vitripennis]
MIAASSLTQLSTFGYLAGSNSCPWLVGWIDQLTADCLAPSKKSTYKKTDYHMSEIDRVMQSTELVEGASTIMRHGGGWRAGNIF